MNEITLHPAVYATGHSTGLVHLLERAWVRERVPGDGEFFLVSGFGNYNGGVRFYDVIRKHIVHGGRMLAVFGGSTSSRLTSKQVVRELLDCGADVRVVNRKRLLHAKCYGIATHDKQCAIVTSGNFTGPGMAQNVEMAVYLDDASLSEMKFSWHDMTKALLEQRWDYYTPTLADPANPAWSLLYDEMAGDVQLDDTQEVTLLLILSHADTARVMASPGEEAYRGSQYFWLSKDSYDFFPPLTIRNERGTKATYSCLVTLHYLDLNETVTDARVTFEAENNLDFRLGTGALRGTKLVGEADLAAVTRIGEREYEVRLFKKKSAEFARLAPYATTFIGHQGKRYGFISNARFLSELTEKK